MIKKSQGVKKIFIRYRYSYSLKIEEAEPTQSCGMALKNIKHNECSPIFEEVLVSQL